MADVQLQHVHVSRSGVEILHDVSLAVPDGGVVAVMGPSGAGKTTLLRVIAGLEKADSGRVVIGGRDVTQLPIGQRDVSFVFQSAALQPHRDVRGNLAFPLRIRRRPAGEIDQRVRAEARAFDIEQLLLRRPATLSAGERHAAATAHALVRPPTSILMDEPVAQLDGPAKKQALRQISLVQAGYGTTMLVATNDQEVAAMLADRIAVLSSGSVLQHASYQDLYRRPIDTTVATLIGTPPMNLLSGVVEASSLGRVLIVAGARLRLERRIVAPVPHVTVGIRPHDLALAPEQRSGLIAGRVDVVEYAGDRVHVHVSARGGERIVATAPTPGPGRGAVVSLAPRVVHVFDRTGRRIQSTPVS